MAGVAWPSWRETNTRSCPWPIRMLANVWRRLWQVTPSSRARWHAVPRPRPVRLRVSDGSAGLGGEYEVRVGRVGGCQAMALELACELGHEDDLTSAGVGLHAPTLAVASHLEAD